MGSWISSSGLDGFDVKFLLLLPGTIPPLSTHDMREERIDRHSLVHL
jgi:hypothetical protein